MRRFSLFKRNGIYYIRLYNTKTGKYLTAKSSGKTDRDEAAVVAVDWLKNGIPEKVAETSRKADDVMTLDAAITSFRTLPLSNDDVSRLIDILKGRELIVSATVQSTTSSARFIDYMEAFWNYDTSPYIREKRLHGQRIGKMKAIDSTRHIKYWKLYFGEEKRLGEMTRADLRDFSLWLAEYKVLPKKKLKKAGSGKKNESSGSASSDKPKYLAAGSINKVILSGTLPLKWAAYHNEIPFDPGKGLMKFSGPARSRGILQEKEVKVLFEVAWKEERAKIASMLSMTTGLRAGEVLALQLVDIGEDRLFINHSWSWADGLKCTKTGKTRVVPLLPVVT